jgi:hypothetical protein
MYTLTCILELSQCIEAVCRRNLLDLNIFMTLVTYVLPLFTTEM